MDRQASGPIRNTDGDSSIAAGLARLCLRPVDAATRERAALHVAAWTGAAALGAAGPLAGRLWQAAAMDGLAPAAAGQDAASACAVSAASTDAATVAASAAAPPGLRDLLFEASLGSLYEIDDTHRAALVHPGPVIVPVVLHLARLRGLPGGQALDALARGYEAAIRLGRAVGPGHYRYWHNTSTCGAVGAAAAAACAMGLDAEGLAHAMRLAATQAAGLWQIRLDDCDAKPWHTSQAALAGLRAAHLAAAGLRGPRAAFEGEKGFFAAMCPGGRAGDVLAGRAVPASSDALPGPDALAAAGASAGSGWLIHEVSFKPWPACRHAHPAIAAALALRERLGRAPASGELGGDGPAGQGPAGSDLPDGPGVTVATYGDAIAFCDRMHPADPGQARFSLQHVIAVALLQGRLGPEHFEPPWLADPDVAALRERIALRADPRWQARYPAHFGAEVTLALRGGGVMRAESADAPGDPEQPLSADAVIALAGELMAAAGWPRDEARSRLSACRALPALRDWSGLPPLRPRLP